MSANDWMTVPEAASWVQRSKHTIYNWVRLSRAGQTETPLVLRRASRISDGKEGSSWLIESRSLQLMDQSAPRCRHAAKKSTDKLIRRGVDTLEKTVQDRQRWVQEWVDEGKSLDRVLAVFGPGLHPEISAYYQQAVTDADG